MQREKYIDLAKGIGILMVIFCHVISLYSLADIEYIHRFCYSFHMPLFFFISGYCLAIKKGTAEKPPILKQLKKTARNLFLPYLVWSIIYMVIANNITKPERIKAVLTTRGIAPIWFLAALGCCQVLFFLIKYLTHKLSEKAQNICLAGTAVLCLVLCSLMFVIKDLYSLSIKNIGTIPFYIYISAGRFFICMPILIAGYFLRKFEIMQKMKKLPCFVGGTLLLAAVWFTVKHTNLTTNLHLFETDSLPLFILTALCGSVSVMMLCYSLPVLTGAVTYIGEYSIYFMLLHYVPFKVISISASTFDFISNSYLFCTCTTLGVVVFCLFGVWIIKNNFFLSRSR